MRAKQRAALALVVILLQGGVAEAAERIYRVGFMTVAAASGALAKASFEGLIRGLAQRGYKIGDNLVIEARYGDGNPDRLPALAKEFVDAKMDVVFRASEIPVERRPQQATAYSLKVPDPLPSGRTISFRLPTGCDQEAVLGMDTEALLLDGLRRLDEMVVFRTRVPGLHASPRATGKKLEGRDDVEGAREVLALCDGERSVAQIAVETALGDFETMRAVYRLLGSGHVAL